MFECIDAEHLIPTSEMLVGEASLQPVEPKRGTRLQKRVLTALRSTGYHELADEFLNCSSRQRCGLHHCNKCRAGWFYSHLDRVMETKNAYYGDTPYGDYLTKLHVRHVTGISALVPLDVKAIRSVINAEKRAFKSFSTTYKRVAVRGFFEIELVHIPLMFEGDACPQKQQTLIEMTDGKAQCTTEVMALVHWHVLMFFLGGTGEEDKVQKWLRKRYPHHRQVSFDRLWQGEHHPVESSLRKLAGYPLKNRHRYNLQFKTDGYADGPYIKAKELSFLVRLSREIPIKQMKITLR